MEKYYFTSNTGGYLWLTGGGPSFQRYGQIGNNSILTLSSPVQTVAGGSTWKQVSVGYLQSAAVKSDGTLWTWGRNSNGQLGDNTTVDKSSPVQTITGGSWSAVSCGYEYITAIKPDGTLWAWGRNNNGQLGDNTTVDKSSPVQTIAGGTNWSSMATGRFTAAAIKTDGTLWLWGAGLYGKLGDNTSNAKSSPVQTVAGGTNWSQVSTSAQFNTSAVKTDGTLWSWGYNGFGMLGDNTTVDKSSPVQTITGGNNWSQVSCGLHYSAAVKSDGTLWAWGANTGGKLGDNTVVGKSSPVQTITRGTNWKQVSCFYHTAAIQYNGTLWVWGDNSSGKLGDNTITNRSSPVQTIMRGQTWRQVSCGYSVTAAISDY
jgi:alpha-tubulin suppressor-like RCC1 family protein